MNQHWITYICGRDLNEFSPIVWILVEAANQDEARKTFLDNPSKDFD